VLEGAMRRAARVSEVTVRFESAPRRPSSVPDVRVDPEPVVEGDPLIGFVVAGRYRIVARLGSGAMGVVYEVEHVELGKLLAMKLLSGEIAHAGPTVRRFKREALLASRLSSPYTAQVFDFGTTDGLTWLVMELVRGADLARVIRDEGPLAAPRLARLVGHVCAALGEAHALGIVHRDIKPGNLMITRDAAGSEIAKVLDFGLAKLRDMPVVTDVSAAGMVLGTPFYMAPEQIQGGAVDGRTDVYALGAVLYRALTGEPVFKGSSPADVCARHMVEDPIAPHVRAPDLAIPEAVSAVVLRALAKSPGARWPDVEALRRALDEAVVGAPVPDDAPGDAGAVTSVAAPLVAGERSLSASGGARASATRDEVAAYERKLAQRTWLGRGVAVLAAVVALGAAATYGVRAIRASTDAGFDGMEAEPNDDPAHASDIPFGRTVSGYLGKRLRDGEGDRDVFRFVVPDVPAGVALRLTALPNMATCALVFAAGTPEPLARSCSERPRRDVVVPALRLAPGPHYVLVMQDRDGAGGGPAPVVENVSDAYHLTVEPAHAP
jgi:serine/threonine-protein kinase